MNLFRLTDSIQADKTIVFHSTRSHEELANIILNKEFSAGMGGGAMLGPGFYANQHLYQAKKHNYGQYILKARIYGIRQFLFLEKEPYETIFGKASSDFVEQQLRDKGCDDILKTFERIFPSGFENAYGTSANRACTLWDYCHRSLRANFGGFVYYGDYDKESIVCWKPDKQVEPLAWSDDSGETWKDLDEIKSDIVSKSSKSENLNKAEMIRSLQRAKDLVERYKNKDDSILNRALKAHLSKIKDPTKLEVRTEVIKKLLADRPLAIEGL